MFVVDLRGEGKPQVYGDSSVPNNHREAPAALFGDGRSRKEGMEVIREIAASTARTTQAPAGRLVA
ncbi:MAG: hypothetical protein CME06_08320, partial [Gemmatimonadetes bacterium]|nr:hypothetical protein [Gemmatimonadota bacterium]